MPAQEPKKQVSQVQEGAPEMRGTEMRAQSVRTIMTVAQGLGEVLASHRGERHIVVLQDFPDPDALASAYAHQLISAAHDIQVDVVYSEQISHVQNAALVRL